MKISLSPRFTLLMIASLFVMPLLLAWLMYSGSLKFDPGAGQNLGTLVEPPLAIDWKPLVFANSGNDSMDSGGHDTDKEVADQLLEHWVILYAVPADCGKPCNLHLASLRQIHLAAGRHQPRIRLALLLHGRHSEESSEPYLSIYRNFSLIRDPSGRLPGLLDRVISEATTTPQPNPGTYLIDPLGNIMMVYSADADPNDIRADLKRLLTWSKLDEQ